MRVNFQEWTLEIKSRPAQSFGEVKSPPSAKNAKDGAATGAVVSAEGWASPPEPVKSRTPAA
ncbi:hypothetical protein SBA7_1210007 [Candidatus Sulfotelmatobacter sp. SbA7]|nr:hypothetical protein SBA7_1210007 [Candidatus Sulfotelmatobacter sp. SbA7]